MRNISLLLIELEVLPRLAYNCLKLAMAMQDSVLLGKKLAAGGFGTVYRGDLMEENGQSTEVVIKKVQHPSALSSSYLPMHICQDSRHCLPCGRTMCRILPFHSSFLL